MELKPKDSMLRAATEGLRSERHAPLATLWTVDIDKPARASRPIGSSHSLVRRGFIPAPVAKHLPATKPTWA